MWVVYGAVGVGGAGAGGFWAAWACGLSGTMEYIEDTKKKSDGLHEL